MTPVDCPSTAQEPRFYRSTMSHPVDLGSISRPAGGYPVNVSRSEEPASSGARYEEVWKLHGMAVPGGVIVKPLRVRLIWESEHVVADAETVNLHAFGGDRMDALVALGERLASHLRYLQHNEHRLAPSMREELHHLRSVVRLTDAEPQL